MNDQWVPGEVMPMAQMLRGCASILDTLKNGDWKECWSPWDNDVRNSISHYLRLGADTDAAIAASRSTGAADVGEDQ